MTKSLINQNYIVDQDASASFESKVITLSCINAGVAFQFKWTEQVSGTFTFYASIFENPYVWETLVSCEEVKFSTESLSSNIVSIPSVWMNCQFMKFDFQPNNGSSGTVSVASRVLPI